MNLSPRPVATPVPRTRTASHPPLPVWTVVGLLVLLVLLGRGTDAIAEEAEIVTAWPLLDYRRASEAPFTSLHLLGPLVKFQRSGERLEYGVRPFFYRQIEKDGSATTDLLYPVGGKKGQKAGGSFQLLHLLEYRSEGEGQSSEFMLFPFLFKGTDREQGEYFAFFPFGGTLYNRFWRDEIRFTLFPIYSKTRKEETTVTNWLWPFFAKISGPEEESGFKAWPLYGASQKEGVYRKRYILWPVFYRYDLKQDTDTPVLKRGAFPFYLAEDSPRLRSRTWLWPFFRHLEDREKGYEEWTFPWPLVVVTKGEDRQGRKYLPLWSDERIGDTRKRWWLWPIFKIEELDTEVIYRRRDRVLFFLYSDLVEREKREGSELRRIALWPLFTYRREDGVADFSTLSLLQPFFPENDAVKRNWSPLWQLYRRVWDRQGNEISTLFWNLYWKERRGESLAWELFPLVRYRSLEGRQTELVLFKGLLGFRSREGGLAVRLFFLPWLGDPAPEGRKEAPAVERG